MGHSYIVYAPLMNGCTTIVYEGKPVRTPNPSAFWRIIEEYKVNVLFQPQLLLGRLKKKILKENGLKFNLDSLRSIFVAGERCDSDTLKWMKSLQKTCD